VSRFGIAVLKPSHNRVAVKRRSLDPNGALVKADHTLFVKLWFMANVSRPGDPDSVAEFLGEINSRSDLMNVHGAVASGIAPSELQPRWSSESRGAARTILDVDRSYIPFDFDKVKLAEGSAAGKGENLPALAEQARDEILPAAFRHCALIIRASSSTGLNPSLGSMHAYALLDQPVPLAKTHRWLSGLQASGLPIDPRPALPGQPFLSGRPEFIGLADPVPEHLRVFVLPGLQRGVDVGDIEWSEFEPQLAAREATEQRAHGIGVAQGWRSVLERYLGDGEGRLGFYRPLSIALGYAARSVEPADGVVGAMHAIVSAHPDLNAERAGQYTGAWLLRELNRMRAKDAARALTSPQTTLFAGALTMIEGCLNARPPLVARAKGLVAQEGDPVVRSHLARRLAAKLAHRALTDDALDVLGLIDGVRPATAPEWFSRYGRRL
jgi:hypothetical protein